MKTIRRYKADDYVFVEDHISRSRANKYNGQSWHSFILWPVYHSRFYLYEADEQVVGFFVIRWKFDLKTFSLGYWLYDVLIYEPFRSHGLGQMLTDILKEFDFKKLRLVVHQDNAIAQNLYKNIGFYQEGRKEGRKLFVYEI